MITERRGELNCFSVRKKIVSILTILVLIVVLISIASNSNHRIYNITRHNSVRAILDLQGEAIFNGWSFVVVEYNNVMTKTLQEILANKNIKASILKYNVSMLVNIVFQKPQVIIVNLLDENVLRELSSSDEAIEVLRKLAHEGTYVLFVSNNFSIIQMISESFDPPLDYPSIPKAVVTKLYKDKKTETMMQDLLIVIGRTYRNTDGRPVPIDVTGAAHVDDSSNMNKIIYQILNQTLIAIANIEFNSSFRG